MEMSSHCAAVDSVCRPRVRTVTKSAVRLLRPSFLDLRFSGDHWIEDNGAGGFDLWLGEYRLTSIQGSALDLPVLNGFLDVARHRRPRWSF